MSFADRCRFSNVSLEQAPNLVLEQAQPEQRRYREPVPLGLLLARSVPVVLARWPAVFLHRFRLSITAVRAEPLGGIERHRCAMLSGRRRVIGLRRSRLSRSTV